MQRIERFRVHRGHTEVAAEVAGVGRGPVDERASRRDVDGVVSGGHEPTEPTMRCRAPRVSSQTASITPADTPYTSGCCEFAYTRYLHGIDPGLHRAGARRTVLSAPPRWGRLQRAGQDEVQERRVASPRRRTGWASTGRSDAGNGGFGHGELRPKRLDPNLRMHLLKGRWAVRSAPCQASVTMSA